jgi:hypothetical protein
VGNFFILALLKTIFIDKPLKKFISYMDLGKDVRLDAALGA